MLGGQSRDERDHFGRLLSAGLYGVPQQLYTPLWVTCVLLGFPQLCPASNLPASCSVQIGCTAVRFPRDGLLTMFSGRRETSDCNPGRGLLRDARLEDSPQTEAGKAWGVAAGRAVCTVHIEPFDIHSLSECRLTARYTLSTVLGPKSHPSRWKTLKRTCMYNCEHI